nr:ImmA/IrrE family metallo-endopeptidase [uncultured Pseudomonas sp.]
MPTTQIDRIFGALESAGYSRAFQNSLLPDWVTGEMLQDEGAALEVASILAKRLGLRVAPLFSDNPGLEELRRRDTKYKRSIPNKSKNLGAATSLAMFVAESVAYATPYAYKPFPENPLELRAEILGTEGGNWLGLRNLLQACWRHGVPVIYLDHIGDGLPKMDGMVTIFDGRPVIILSKRSTSWAWQSFIIAHEIGHCALGHIEPDEILIDETLGEQSYALDDPDEDEQAADRFAIAILNGRDDATYGHGSGRMSSRGLADAAMAYGQANHVDPGHVVLNFAKHNNAWALGMAAINILQADLKPAGSVVNDLLWRSVRQDVLPEDTIELLRRVAPAE